MACGLAGSIGIGDSASYAFDERGQIALREAIREAIARAERTADIGGSLGTVAFTEAVIGTLRARLRR